MAMKKKIYSPAEMPTILKASFRVELDDSLMEKLLSPDMEQVLGPDLYEMFLYRTGKGKNEEWPICKKGCPKGQPSFFYFATFFRQG